MDCCFWTWQKNWLWFCWRFSILLMLGFPLDRKAVHWCVKPPFSPFFFPLRFHSTSSPDACYLSYHRDEWQCPVETIFLFFLSCLLKPLAQGPSPSGGLGFSPDFEPPSHSNKFYVSFQIAALKQAFELEKVCVLWGKAWWRKRSLNFRNTELC